MTSNQIAYANMLESQRHDVQVEQETNRHNLATEQLSAEELNLERDKNNITREYNQAKVSLEKEYNDWYRRYSEASTAAKLRLEAEGNRIKQNQVDVTDWYNRRSYEISKAQNALDTRKQSELERHNGVVEQIDRERNSIDYWYREKEIDYKNRALETDSNLRNDVNLINAFRAYADVASNPAKSLVFSINEMGRRFTNNEPFSIYNLLYGGNYGKKEKPRESERSEKSDKERGITFNIREGEFVRQN